jgi:hypothetical protein
MTRPNRSRNAVGAPAWTALTRQTAVAPQMLHFFEPAKSIIAVGFLIIAAIVKADIDLTPTPMEYMSEGIKYQKLIFRKDQQRVEYNPPPGWSFRGSADRVQLTPTKKRFAEALIEAVPLAGPQPLDEKVVKALGQQFISSLPPGSQFVAIVGEERNPVLLDGSPTFEVTACYQVIGEKFLKSALFVNLPDTQLIFRLAARKDDFEALHSDFKRSILSWHWVEPKPSAQEAGASAAR